MKRILAFVGLVLVSNTALAKITISGIEGASVYDNSVSTTGVSTVTVYGGIAGESTRCPTGTGSSTTATCNNCRLLTTETVPAPSPDSLLLPCNERRINPNLLLAITFSSDSTTGATSVTTSNGDTALTASSGSISVPATKGSLVTVTIPWSAICAQIFSDKGDAGSAAECLPASGKTSGVIRIGVTPNGNGLLNTSTDDFLNINVHIRSITGTSLAKNCSSAGSDWQICYFEMGPGDGKAVVKSLLGPSSISFPATDFKSVRFLFAEGEFNQVTMASSHVDLPIKATDTTTFEVSPRRIEGLSNDVKYSFKSALVDVAGNIGFYSAAANDTDCSNATDVTSVCRQATPSEVAGVLANSNCFIATASYGSNFAIELDTLRDFRDQILMASDLGRKFVRFYYENSPRYAQMISESPVARASVRAALVPVVWFAGMALAHGPLKTGLAVLASLIVIAALISMGRRPEVRTAARAGFNEVKERARRSFLPLIIGMLLVGGGAHHAKAASDELIEESSTEIMPLEELAADPFDEETPPEPEYPYPKAQAPAPIARPAQPNNEPSPLEKAERRFSKEQRPKLITDEGEYIYESLPAAESRHHGPPKMIKFSGDKGRERPATISSDGEFTYPVGESPFTGAAGLRFGMMGAPGITNTSNGMTFKQIYGSNELPGLLVEYEYPLTRAIGRIGLKFETGAYYAQARGRFVRPSRVTDIPEERFTFLMVPLQAMIHYRFQFWDAQWIVPFVEGGAAYNGIVELRDDNKTPKVGGAAAAVASGGVNILLDWLDRHAIRQLDAEYGINHVWFTAQYRQIFGLKKEIDFTTHLISAGFTFDF